MLTREIIFRGLDENGKWVIGSLMQNKGETPRIMPEHDHNEPGRWLCVKSETVQQFTGLYDIKRVPIYENDIVTIKKTGSEFTEVGIVRFDNFKVYVEKASGDKPLFQYDLCNTEFEVIGNEVTDEDKCLLQRIDNFLENFIADDFDSLEFPETNEMYALIRDTQKYLKKQIGADTK